MVIYSKLVFNLCWKCVWPIVWFNYATKLLWQAHEFVKNRYSHVPHYFQESNLRFRAEFSNHMKGGFTLEREHPHVPHDFQESNIGFPRRVLSSHGGKVYYRKRTPLSSWTNVMECLQCGFECIALSSNLDYYYWFLMSLCVVPFTIEWWLMLLADQGKWYWGDPFV